MGGDRSRDGVVSNREGVVSNRKGVVSNREGVAERRIGAVVGPAGTSGGGRSLLIGSRCEGRFFRIYLSQGLALLPVADVTDGAGGIGLDKVWSTSLSGSDTFLSRSDENPES